MEDLRGDAGLENDGATDQPGQRDLFAWVPTMNWRALVPYLSAVVGLALLGVIGWAALQQRWRGLGLVEKLYDQLRLFGRALGQKADPSLTPHEYASKVGAQVPPAASTLSHVADLFTRQRFSTTPTLDPEEEAAMSEEWITARKQLMRRLAQRIAPLPSPADEIDSDDEAWQRPR